MHEAGDKLSHSGIWSEPRESLEIVAQACFIAAARESLRAAISV
ncbi:hypothetical protein [Rubritalea marina]|nr:hypothetical protein [Rubritalea marina]